MSNTSIKFSVEFGKSTISLCDNTGKYHIVKNKTGWGRPNISLKTVKRTEIHIYMPNETEPLIYFPDTSVLPSDSFDKIDISSSEFDLEKFPPGSYKIDYLVYYGDDSKLKHSGCVFLNEYNIKCCIDKKKVEIDLFDTSSDKAKKLIEHETLLTNSRLAFELGRFKDVNKILKYLDHQCHCTC